MQNQSQKKLHISETDEQIKIIEWARFMERASPELALLYHVPNGGKRSMSEAARFKREGVKAGVPDLCLPVPRGGYHGLCIELKAVNGKPSDYQLQWLTMLSQQGYCAKLCYGADEAIRTIDKYLKGGIAL